MRTSEQVFEHTRKMQEYYENLHLETEQSIKEMLSSDFLSECHFSILSALIYEKFDLYSLDYSDPNVQANLSYEFSQKIRDIVRVKLTKYEMNLLLEKALLYVLTNTINLYEDEVMCMGLLVPKVINRIKHAARKNELEDATCRVDAIVNQLMVNALIDGKENELKKLATCVAIDFTNPVIFTRMQEAMFGSVSLLVNHKKSVANEVIYFADKKVKEHSITLKTVQNKVSEMRKSYTGWAT